MLLSRAATAAELQFGKVTATGTTRWAAPVAVEPGALSVNGVLPPGSAVGLAVRVVSGRLPPHQAVIVAGSRAYELDGSLSSAVRPGAWRQAKSIGGYTVFARTLMPTPVYAERNPGQPRALIDVLSEGDNAETIRVRTPGPAVIVRDVAWDSGWHASVAVNGGAPHPTAIARHGLVQQIRLPGGNDAVTFTYEPQHWPVASALSEGSTVLLVLLLVDVVRRRARHRRAAAEPEVAQPD
jgi:hypothetical protein